MDGKEEFFMRRWTFIGIMDDKKILIDHRTCHQRRWRAWITSSYSVELVMHNTPFYKTEPMSVGCDLHLHGQGKRHRQAAMRVYFDPQERSIRNTKTAEATRSCPQLQYWATGNLLDRFTMTSATAGIGPEFKQRRRCRKWMISVNLIMGFSRHISQSK